MKAQIASLVKAVCAWLGLPPMWWLGKPYRVTIAPAADRNGYVLKIGHRQGVEWVDLPGRPDTDPPARPDEREFAAASAALAVRGLAWVLPWDLDAHGNLPAPVTVTPAAKGDPHA